MGRRSSFGRAFRPLERAQDVQFNIVMEKYWLVKEISCLEVMDFVKYLNGSPTPSFFPGLRLGLGGRVALGCGAACNILTDSQIHSHIFKPFKFSKVTILNMHISHVLGQFSRLLVLV